MSGAVITPSKVTLGDFGYKDGLKNPKTNVASSNYVASKPYYVITMKNCVVLFPRLTYSSKNTSVIYSMWFMFDIDGFSGANTFGKDIFILQVIPSTGSVEFVGETMDFNSNTGLPSTKGDRPSILADCKANGTTCGALIKKDSWKILGDYPWFK